MRHSSLPGRADSVRLAIATLLAMLLHLALARVPIAWRAPAVSPAAPIQISLLLPPAAPPAAAPGPATPPAAAPGPATPTPPAAPASVAEIAPVPQTAPSKPESKPEPAKPRRPVVTAKVAKPREPVRPVARPKPVKPKSIKPKPAKSKPTHSRPTKLVKPAPEPPAQLAARQPSPALLSPAGGGGLGDGAVGGASASRGAGGAPATTETNLRPLPGNPQPRYPSLARRRGEEGRVLLRLTVNATGRVEAVSVARSSGYELLDQEAQRTVARWRFQSPPTERMVAQIPITFRLRD